MKVASFLQKNSFVLGLLLAFVVSDLLVSWWNPMASSRRFYKNDFTKTLYHHSWSQSGPVFFGNSSVTGAYIEEKSAAHLVEMGLSYGKLTDLQDILKHNLYQVQKELVIGIDVHTMLDSLETDPTYQWFKPVYQPYVYTYRDYFRDSGEEFAKNLLKGSLAYEPRWIDKELYPGRKDNTFLKSKWDDYDKRFGSMTLKDFKANLTALNWIINYADEHQLSLRVIWMPWNKDYADPPYVTSLKQEVNRQLEAANVPTLDLMHTYDPRYFHDLVHLNREEGAPLFTKEVDAWLKSLEKPSRS
ncbi:hypothetical protein GK047_22680 [Paenibacillus sp. SYP-B3998]|uniref:SGNH/GDSL hydrolase family protein n=1 Tax=Paenibacillus sp. SYP-B3998 TaxID=2678564 RepID=A0A6G4A2T1_9BACL|nr:hypothetical protein [Paenibacillus sp. SYP-B3998]NEW08806.1 hypothetical protein [Paenibacillus sp. SYP-B3998]